MKNYLIAAGLLLFAHFFLPFFRRMQEKLSLIGIITTVVSNSLRPQK